MPGESIEPNLSSTATPCQRGRRSFGRLHCRNRDFAGADQSRAYRARKPFTVAQRKGGRGHSVAVADGGAVWCRVSLYLDASRHSLHQFLRRPHGAFMHFLHGPRLRHDGLMRLWHERASRQRVSARLSPHRLCARGEDRGRERDESLATDCGLVLPRSAAKGQRQGVTPRPFPRAFSLHSANGCATCLLHCPQLL